MNIGKSNNNFKNEKPKCFNYNKYGNMAKKCWKKKRKRQEDVSNMTKKGTLPRIAKESNQ